MLQRHWGIAVLLGVFLITGAIYGVVTPVFEAPDEPWHYAYAVHLADGGGLPVQSLEEDQPWRQEGSQPPLYYALGALLLRPLDLGGAEHIATYNPHVELGVPSARANVNMVLHGDGEGHPYQGHILGVHLVRTLSILLSASTIWVTYRLTLELFPDSEWLAVGAAAINAFTPQFLFIGSSVNNDSAIALLASLVLWLLVRLAKGERRAKSLIWLGVILGLAGLAKLSGLGLWALAGITFLWLAWKERSLRVVVWQAGMVFAVAAFISGWWYVRNWMLYGDITGANVMLQIVGRRAHAPDIWGLLSEIHGLGVSYWAIFGWFNILADKWVYVVFEILVGAAVLGWGIALARCLLQRRVSIDLRFALPVTWSGIVLFSLARWTRMTPATQGRLLFPAIGAISMMLAWGIIHWVPSRWHHLMVGLVALLLWGVALAQPFSVVAPAYDRPNLLGLHQIPLGANDVMADYGDRIRLVACEFERSAMHPGEVLKVTLYWQALKVMDENYSVFIHLVGPDGQPMGQADSYPGGGMYPTRQWMSGEIVKDVYWVPVEADVEAALAVDVEVGLYVLSEYSNLSMTDALGRPVGRVVAGRIKVAPNTMPDYNIPNRVLYELGSQIALIGYEIADPNVEPGECLRVDLYWQSLAPATADYTVFVHLLDSDDRQWSQGDKRPQKGYSTLLWEVGEIVLDRCEIPVPLDSSPGKYRISVGMYRADNMQRLPVSHDGQPVSMDRILLDEPVCVLGGE